MRKEKVFLLGIIFPCLITFTVGCGQMRTAEGGVRPKKSKFLLSTHFFSLESNDKIDTNVLYLNVEKDMALGSGGRGSSYQFFSFYKNGRFRMSNSYENFADYSKFQSIKAGIIGYYQLTGDTLLCEFFAPTNGGEYVFIDGYIRNGFIILTKMYPRHMGAALKLTDTLIKTAIKKTPGNTDW